MTNKYLEKIALNKYEGYLVSRPDGYRSVNPAINRAHKNLVAARQQRGIAHGIAAVGGTHEATVKHLGQAQDFTRKNRGVVFSGKRVKIQSPFSNTGDSLRRRSTVLGVERMMERIRDNTGLRRKPGLLARSFSLAKTRGFKVGVGILGGAAIGYGANSLRKNR